MTILAKIKIYYEELDQVLLGLAKAGYPVTAEIDYGKDGNHTDGWWVTIYNKPENGKIKIDTRTTTTWTDKPGAGKIWDYTTTDIPVDRPKYYAGTDPEMLKGGATSF